ncbi:MAG TPA: glycoside hydrolase family 3 N-terminal domain-containing protein, partial [Candidatus Dormibacteraeota bacterium]|nr:glycoside hydrolase family 3 N-terminal domain-containing protein [Candidatus Dormibacteraeota bacterium]
MDALSRLARGCLLAGFEGTDLQAWIGRGLEDGLGGLVLYARNLSSPAQLARLTSAVHDTRDDTLIAIDEEGGDVTRLEAATGSSYPGNLALGRIDDVTLTHAVAGQIGRELVAAGIDLDLAPVADVNSNPDNPVIGVRSFGDRPGDVAA